MPTLPKPTLSEATSTYGLDQLLSLWRRGDLTGDQMVGHLLQHLIQQDQRLHHLEHLPTLVATRPVVASSAKM